MATRAANLIGLQGHLLQRASDELELAYDLRNDAVHDGFFDSANLARMPYHMDSFLT